MFLRLLLALNALALSLASALNAATPAGDTDWPQLGGPHRNGIIIGGPKLLDAWNKEGPPLLWESAFIPASRDGGCCPPVVAEGKVFVYANKQPNEGLAGFQMITPQTLALFGWQPDLPDALARQIEAARVAATRPDTSEWQWWLPASLAPEAVNAYLVKKPQLDKYIKDFLATLPPAEVAKHGEFIRRRLCMDTPRNKWGRPDALSWDQLIKLSAMQGALHGSSVEWTWLLRDCGPFSLSHHISFSPDYELLWRAAFTWSDTLYCLDAATGKTLWKKSFPVDKSTLVDPAESGHPVQWWEFNRLGACGTPTACNGKVYMAGSAGLYCLAAQDGALIWQVKSGPEHASPLVEDGIVFHLGVAYDAATGAVKWKNPEWALFDGKHSRNEGEGRYSTPTLWTSGGRKYILTTNGHEKQDLSVVCLELETGKVAWKTKCYIPFGSTVAALDGDLLIEAVKENTAISQCFKMTPSGTELLWKGGFNGGGPVYLGNIYAGGQCVSLSTGDVLWRANGAVCNANVLADGKVIGSQNSGGYTETVTVGMSRATPDKYEPLGSFNPEAITMTPIIVANGKLLVRQKDRVACFDIQEHKAYLESTTATKETLTFCFKQTGGGIGGDLSKVVATTGGTSGTDGTTVPAKAKVDGENLIVDVKDLPVPFSIGCPAGVLTGKSGVPLPALVWNEARQLVFKKAVDNRIVLKTSDRALQRSAVWTLPETYTVAGAKITSAVLDPLCATVTLTTDKVWKPGDVVKITYAAFKTTQGEPRRESLDFTVTEPVSAAAKFVKTDTATLGNWRGVYGAEGALVAGDGNTAAAPKFMRFSARNCTIANRWAQNDQDPNHLQFTGGKGRSIQEWTTEGEFFINLEFTDANEHQVAVYLGGQRACSVEVLDAETKASLDTQTFPDNSAYQYKVWKLKGNICLRLLSVGGTEASTLWVGGVFVDRANAEQRSGGLK